ncbi:MAG: hypothetical protein IJ460_02380 [Clostridia bacterium]|nr:hypothetical protein [Clostridia bacterium]
MLKRIISFVIVFIVTVLFCTNALAFDFPQPDWGALLKDKQYMVDTTHYGLYAEGSLETAPYYGAKFEPRGGVYLGSIAETAEPILPLSSYLTYVEGMTQPDLYYPANQMIKNDNVISMIGWTINSLDEVDYNVVRNVLDTLNSYNKPMFIRFANEMNVSPTGDDPNRYVEVFRTVANMIHEYPNFAVVWSPNDLGGLDRPFEYYYPGDEYVDWVGVSCYMIKYFQSNPNTSQKDSVYFMTGDNAWAINRIKPIVNFMKKNNINKPLMISEGGVPTNNKFGEELSDWAAPRLRNMLYSLIMAYPQIKMINYFNNHRQYETERFDINNYPYAVDIFNEAKNSGAYITEYGSDAEFCYSPVSNAGALAAKDGIVNLYTLAHFPKNPSGIYINYTVDGEWYHSSNTIPYTCPLNISDMPDGAHNLTVSTLGQEIVTTFYKKGQYIRFGAEPEVPGYSAVNSGYETVEVVINGEKMNFDSPAIIKESRTLVPLRGIFESLNATVEWDDATQTVTAVRDGIIITLTIGGNKMMVNNRTVELDVPAQLVNDRTYVPARAVSEALNANVQWDDASRTVSINNYYLSAK